MAKLYFYYAAMNHLQALFRKPDTNPQSDLLRILDRVARQ